MAVEHCLVIQHGDRKTLHVLQGQTTVVGRDGSSDLFFVDHKLSRRHARLEIVDADVDLIDLGSRNGCWVNGARISRQRLHPGDILRIGSLRMHFYVESKPDDQQSRAEVGDPVTATLVSPPPYPAEATVPVDRRQLSSPEPAEATVPVDRRQLSSPEPANAVQEDSNETDPDARVAASVVAEQQNLPVQAESSPESKSAATRTRTMPATGRRRRPALPLNRRRAITSRVAALLFLAGGLVYLVPGIYNLIERGQPGVGSHGAEAALEAMLQTNRPLLAASAMTALDLRLVDQVPALKGGWIVDPDEKILHQHGPLALSDVLSGAAGNRPGDVEAAGLYLLQTPILGANQETLGSLLVAYDATAEASRRPYPAIAFVVVGLVGLVAAGLLFRFFPGLPVRLPAADVSARPSETQV